MTAPTTATPPRSQQPPQPTPQGDPGQGVADPEQFGQQLEGLVDTLSAGDRPDPSDRRGLESVVGKGPADRLMAALASESHDARQQAMRDARAAQGGGGGGPTPGAEGKSPKKKPGFWGWLAGPGINRADPLPGPIAALILRAREGRPLDADDMKALARVFGIGGLRAAKALMDALKPKERKRWSWSGN